MHFSHYMEIRWALVANAVLTGIRFWNACAVGASEANLVQMLGKNLEVLLKVRRTRNAKRPWSDGYFGRAREMLVQEMSEIQVREKFPLLPLIMQSLVLVVLVVMPGLEQAVTLGFIRRRVTASFSSS